MDVQNGCAHILLVGYLQKELCYTCVLLHCLQSLRTVTVFSWALIHTVYSSACASFNFQQEVFTLWWKPFTKTTASSSRWGQNIHSVGLQRDDRLPQTFSTQLHIWHIFHTSKPNTITGLGCTLPSATVNIICILSMSGCSYPEQLSVRGKSRGSQAALTCSMVNLNFLTSALLKCKYHTLWTKSEGATVDVYPPRRGLV